MKEDEKREKERIKAARNTKPAVDRAGTSPGEPKEKVPEPEVHRNSSSQTTLF